MAPRSALRLALAATFMAATVATTTTAGAVPAAVGVIDGAAQPLPVTADLSGVASAAVAAPATAGGDDVLKITAASALPSFVTLSAAAGDATVPVDGDDDVGALLSGGADATDATARVATSDASLTETAASRSISSSVVAALIRGIRATTFRQNIIKIVTTLAYSTFRGRQTRFTYNVLVIRRSRLLRSSLRDIDYYGVWSFRGVSHVVVLFRSGTLRHKAFGGLSEMGYWAERSSSGRGVVYFQTPL